MRSKAKDPVPKRTEKKRKRARPSSSEGRRTIEFGQDLIRQIDNQRNAEGYMHFAEFVRAVIRQYLKKVA